MCFWTKKINNILSNLKNVFATFFFSFLFLIKKNLLMRREKYEEYSETHEKWKFQGSIFYFSFLTSHFFFHFFFLERQNYPSHTFQSIFNLCPIQIIICMTSTLFFFIFTHSLWTDLIRSCDLTPKTYPNLMYGSKKTQIVVGLWYES